jgi:hypothetical protein
MKKKLERLKKVKKSINKRIDTLKKVDDRFFDTKSKIEALNKLLALSLKEKMNYIKKICSGNKVIVGKKKIIIFESQAKVNELKKEIEELEKVTDANVDEWIKGQIANLAAIKSTHREEYARNRKLLDYLDRLTGKLRAKEVKQL